MKFKDRLIIGLAIVFAFTLLAVNFSKAEPVAPPTSSLVTEVYTVRADDDLGTIAVKFVAKSSVQREAGEFKEGIIQENWSIFQNRKADEVFAGDILKINYWGVKR